MAATIKGDNPDQYLEVKPSMKFSRVRWTVKNESNFDWHNQGLGK